VRLTLTDRLVRDQTPESSAFTVTAKFWDDSTDVWTASTPTTARYRIDDPDTGSEILAWTSLTPATSISIDITATNNAIVDDSCSTERRQITVQANAGLSTQYQGTMDYWIRNLAGQL
jgi:hypothetical protein